MKKLAAGEVYQLSLSVVLSTAVLFLPFLIASASLQDSWIAVIVGTIVSIPFTLIAITLVYRFPEKGLEEILEELFGKIMGRIVALLYAGVFMYTSAIVIRQLEEFVIRALLPETPPVALRILFVVVLIYGVYEGTLAIARTNVYVMPVGIVVIGIVIGLATPKMSFDNITPIFTMGIEQILEGSFLTIGWLLQIPLLIMVFFKFIETAKLKPKIKAESVLVIIATGVALLLGALSTIATFGPRQTATLLYPSFNMARVIDVGGFLEHIEVSFVGVWIAAMFICATVYCFMGILMITWVLGLKDYKKLAIPIAATLFYLPAAVADDISHLLDSLRTIFPSMIIAFGGVLPFIFLVMSVVMNKGVPPKELKKLQEESEKNQPEKNNFGVTKEDIQKNSKDKNKNDKDKGEGEKEEGEKGEEGEENDQSSSENQEEEDENPNNDDGKSGETDKKDKKDKK